MVMVSKKAVTAGDAGGKKGKFAMSYFTLSRNNLSPAPLSFQERGLG
jgi:hypothetical protein